jgi:hypothetical protein
MIVFVLEMLTNQNCLQDKNGLNQFSRLTEMEKHQIPKRVKVEMSRGQLHYQRRRYVLYPH